LSGGTRTFESPDGDGTQEDEKIANKLNDWTAESMEIIHAAGKVFTFENQAEDGHYPKAWNRSSMKRAIKKTGAVIVSGVMCKFELAPPDMPDRRHKKKFWLCASKELMPWIQLMYGNCDLRDHVSLAGNIPGTSLRRTQFAARYTVPYCRSKLNCIEQAYEGDTPYQPTRRALGFKGAVEAHTREQITRGGEQGSGGDDAQERAEVDRRVSEPEARENKPPSYRAAGPKGTEESYRQRKLKTREMTNRYIDLCVAQEKFDPDHVKAVTEMGTDLIRLAGHWKPCVQEIRNNWVHRFGNSLNGVFDAELDTLVDPELLEYVREIAEHGVPGRQTEVQGRWRTKPHRSAQDHVKEAYEKMWKDAHKGRTLLCSAELTDELDGILAEPMGRVPKQNPDRTFSDEGRFVHDQRKVNAQGSKYNHPPALQPRHRELARTILWWKLRLPGIEIVMAKYDVDSAYKLIWVKVNDVCLFATELPGEVLGLEGNVMILSLSLVFGWGGAPGEYMAFAWLNKLLYQAAAPAHLRWHDEVPFHCKTLMDDQVMVEPAIGVRPYIAAWWAKKAMTQVFGAGAINQKKLEEEGRFETKKINWGLEYDTVAETITLPEPKIAKIRFLVNEEAFQFGNTAIPMHLLRSLIGILIYGTSACPILLPEMGALYRLLQNNVDGQANVRVEGDEDEVRRVWKEAWEVFEMIRVLVEDPQIWSSHFTSGLAAILNNRERLALPGMMDTLVWTGGDSTLQTLGAADWNAKVYGVIEVERVAGPLKAFAGHEEDDTTIIAIGELLCALVLAASRMQEWTGCLVPFVTDNTNVEIWIFKRVAGNRVARFGLRLLGMMENEGRFKMIAAGINTHHNATMDYLTRAQRAAYQAEMAAKGFSEMDFWPAWKELFERLEAGMVLTPLQGSLASKVAAQRVVARRGTVAPKPGAQLKDITMMEWRPTLGGYARAWNRRGAHSMLMKDERDRTDWTCVQPGSMAVVERKDATACDWMCASLTPDKSGKEMLKFVKAAHDCHSKWVFVDLPREAEYQEGITKLSTTHKVRVFQLLTSWYGDCTAKRRTCVLGYPMECGEADVLFFDLLQRHEAAEPEGPRGILLPVDALDEELWRRVKVTDIPRVRADDDRFLPTAVGTWKDEAGNKKFVYCALHPMPTMQATLKNDLGYANALIRDEREPDAEHGSVRTLAPYEVWRMHGHTAGEWRRLLNAGMTVEDLMAGAAQTMPTRSATALVDAMIGACEMEQRAGVGYDRDEEKAWNVWTKWLEAWRRNPELPGPEFSQWLEEQKQLRAGAPEADVSANNAQVNKMTKFARTKKPSGAQLEIEKLFNPSKLNWDFADCDARTPKVGGENYAAFRRQLQLRFISNKVGEGTHTTYSSGWKLWKLFMRARERDPFLRGRSMQHVLADEERLLDFIVHLVQLFHRTENTVKTKLMAVRYHHLTQGLPDPLEDKERLWLALGGIKRLQGRGARRLPVTVQMLRWADENFKVRSDDHLVVFVAGITAWFFLLRMGEYTTTDTSGWKWERVLTGRDVIPRRGGKEIKSFADADEVVIYIKGSKTDQYNAGCIRNHYRTGDPLCPVEAMAQLQKRFPERWGDEDHLPLFRKADGKSLPADALAGMAKESAAACGVDPDEVDTHSYKIGGATAMWHGTGEYVVVKRFGRWATDTVQDYLWEFHERQKGLGTLMIKADYELTAPIAKKQDQSGVDKRRVKFELATKAGCAGMPFGCLMCGRTGCWDADFRCNACRTRKANDLAMRAGAFEEPHYRCEGRTCRFCGADATTGPGWTTSGTCPECSNVDCGGLHCPCRGEVDEESDEEEAADSYRPTVPVSTVTNAQTGRDGTADEAPMGCRHCGRVVQLDRLYTCERCRQRTEAAVIAEACQVPGLSRIEVQVHHSWDWEFAEAENAADNTNLADVGQRTIGEYETPNGHEERTGTVASGSDDTSLTRTFGWVDAPGEYVAVAQAATLRDCPACGAEGEYDAAWESGRCVDCRALGVPVGYLDDEPYRAGAYRQDWKKQPWWWKEDGRWRDRNTASEQPADRPRPSQSSWSWREDEGDTGTSHAYDEERQDRVVLRSVSEVPSTPSPNATRMIQLVGADRKRTRSTGQGEARNQEDRDSRKDRRTQREEDTERSEEATARLVRFREARDERWEEGRVSPQPAQPSRTLWIGGLRESVMTEELHAHCQQVLGDGLQQQQLWTEVLAEAKTEWDAKSWEMIRGTAALGFKSEAAALKAQTLLHETLVRGKAISVKPWKASSWWENEVACSLEETLKPFSRSLPRDDETEWRHGRVSEPPIPGAVWRCVKIDELRYKVVARSTKGRKSGLRPELTVLRWKRGRGDMRADFDITMRTISSDLWHPTPYVNEEESLVGKEQRIFQTEISYAHRADVVPASKPLRGPPGFSYSPLEGYVTSLGEWWRCSIKYMKELFTRARFSLMCDAGLAMNAMVAGQWLIVGAADDGEIATGPRDAWDGVNLMTGYKGGPFPKHMTLDIYIGIAPSAIPRILKFGLRGFLRPGDRERQLTHNGDVEPVPVAYGSRLKRCAAGYPWQMHIKQERAGELFLADGTKPLVSLLQCKLVLKDADDAPTILWEKKVGNNDQVAFDPWYCCIQTIHYYAVAKAFRPFRATGFSEYAILQHTNLGWCSLRDELQWNEHEYIRRLRRAERQICTADILLGDYRAVVPSRLAPMRTEPRRRNETREAADERGAERLTDEFVREQEAGGHPVIFDDDTVIDERFVDDREEETDRERQAQWWNTSQYRVVATEKRVQEAIDAGKTWQEVHWLRNQNRTEQPRPFSDLTEAERDEEQLRRIEGRVSRRQRSVGPTRTRAVTRVPGDAVSAQRARTHAASDGDQRDRQPAVELMTIDKADRTKWLPCAGNCGFWNVGTCGHNFCCSACSVKAGNHGRRCERYRIKGNDDVPVDQMISAGRCAHNADPAECDVCSGAALQGGEEWCTDLLHFQGGGFTQPTPIAQPRFQVQTPKVTGATVADSSMQRMVDDARPRLYLVCEGAPEERRVWSYSVPGASALPGASDRKVSSWAIFWRLQGGMLQKCRFYLVPQKDSVRGNWGSSGRQKAMKRVLDEVGTEVMVLPTVKQMLGELGLTEEEVFVWDWFHMTRKATKSVHNQCWKHIGQDIAERGASDEYPILIWDFNVSSKHLTDEFDLHVKFWRLASQWGLAAGDRKPEYVRQINQLVGVRREVAHIDETFYEHSRLKIIKYKDDKKVAQEIDENQLDEVDEYADAFCPDKMPGDAIVERGVVGSRLWSEHEAERGKWPANTKVKQWHATLRALLWAIHGSHDEEFARRRLDGAKGEYRMYFAALVRVKCWNLNTKKWEEGLHPDTFLQIGREAGIQDVD